jgi:hypothetical protein
MCLFYFILNSEYKIDDENFCQLFHLLARYTMGEINVLYREWDQFPLVNYKASKVQRNKNPKTADMKFILYNVGRMLFLVKKNRKFHYL